jgi:hypothetical protein
MIIALAGRRVDAAETEQRRFPSQSIKLVKKRIHDLFRTERANVLVSSAASGADLLALSEAHSMGLRLRIVLPFGRAEFRATSVADRPGKWGTLYDELLDQVEKNRDLVVVRTDSDAKAFTEANRVILDEAQTLGHHLHDGVIAVLVWNGKSRGAEDLTEDFRRRAFARDIPVVELMTL